MEKNTSRLSSTKVDNDVEILVLLEKHPQLSEK